MADENPPEELKRPLAALPYFQKAVEVFSKQPKPTLAQVKERFRQHREQELRMDKEEASRRKLQSEH